MAWTAEQQLAIDTRDRTLLVSAAAGSGKTATLTERIIQSILDEDHPGDIGRMLIATYTNAAVDELRERVSKKVKEQSAKDPKNKRLEEQLLRIKDARIMTITSFCNSILRSCAESIGLPPNYRIAEPPEVKILSSGVLEGLINAAYSGELCDVCTAEEFIALGDALASVKHTEELAESINFIFDKLKSCEAGIDTLLPLIEEYNPDSFTTVEQTKLGGYIFSYAKDVFEEYVKAYKKIIPLATGEKIDEKNLAAAQSDLGYIESFISARGYAQLRDALALFNAGRIARPKEDKTSEFSETFELLHDYLTDDVKAFKTKYFLYTEDEWRELYRSLYAALGVFYRFLKKYYTVFREEKKKRGICEFSDVERYAYEALYDENGERTELAHELASKFDAVYVDEYQDVNGLQSKIFEAISKSDNRFMVGDIKQSIYGFRSAKPEIFARMKNKFPPLGSANDYPAASIFMSNNFRCDEFVVDFVNGIFDTFFGLVGDNIGYVEGDKLKFSKIYPDGSAPTRHVPEIHLVEKTVAETVATDTEDNSDDDEHEDKAAAAAEAECIVNKISELLRCGTLANGSQIQPKDIAVLMRSVKGTCAKETTARLSSLGINVSVVDTGNLFLCEAVLLALSFLYSIDNPRRDIYLAALMCSPLFGFSADELLVIRRESEKETLWEALIEYVNKNPDYEHGVRFITSLVRYRKLAEGQKTDVLLSLIYRESGLMALAAKNGDRENLILLHSYARKYEQSDFKGLYSFISYVNDMIESGEEFGAADSNTEENAVRLMTVHKSKGLEFPVCILANTASRGKVSTEKIAFSDGFGISFKLRDDTGLALVENPAGLIINHHIKRCEYDEELRVLYVALTRAREMLYVFGSCSSKDPEKYAAKLEILRSLNSKYFITKAKSFLDMVLAGRKCGKLVFDTPALSAAQETIATANGGTEDVGTEHRGHNVLSAEDYRARFSFVYPLHALETLPEKISVSKLSPTVLDGTEGTEAPLTELLISEGLIADAETNASPTVGEDEKRAILPKFITGIVSGESAKRGIATHTVMQFCDLDRLKENVKAELDRLTQLEFISREDAERVRIKELEKFTHSALFDKMKAAKQLYRELRFNVKLPAERFTRDEERAASLSGKEVLVQGVIDCIIEDFDGNLHLIDYKTDRLSREELSNEALGEARLLRAHTLQLSYYADAIELMFGKRPAKVGIYSLHLGREIDVPIDKFPPIC